MTQKQKACTQKIAEDVIVVSMICCNKASVEKVHLGHEEEPTLAFLRGCDDHGTDTARLDINGDNEIDCRGTPETIEKIKKELRHFDRIPGITCQYID